MQEWSESYGVGAKELHILRSLGSRVMSPAGKPPTVILNYLASLWQQVTCEGSAAVAEFLVPGTLP